MLTKEQIEAINRDIPFSQLTKRAQGAISYYKVKKLGELARLTESAILQIHKVGECVNHEICTMLKSNGLYYGMDWVEVSDALYRPTDREVLINKGYLKINRGGCIFCHTRITNGYQTECQDDCAAFAIKDGCAICKMMHGDQVIGRLVEKGTGNV